MPRTMRLRGGGWLKPADSLLEPKGHWEAHRDPPPDGPVPEPVEGVQALGKTVRGLRIGAGGSRALLNFDLETRISKDCVEEEMVLDNTFDFVPVPLLLGVPLMFKRLSFHDVGEEEQKEQELRYETKMYAYKLMTTPGLGLPLTWNQNGAGTRLPPILACRSDGQPFTTQDWQVRPSMRALLAAQPPRAAELALLSLSRSPALSLSLALSHISHSRISRTLALSHSRISRTLALSLSHSLVTLILPTPNAPPFTPLTLTVPD